MSEARSSLFPVVLGMMDAICMTLGVLASEGPISSRDASGSLKCLIASPIDISSRSTPISPC